MTNKKNKLKRNIISPTLQELQMMKKSCIKEIQRYESSTKKPDAWLRGRLAMINISIDNYDMFEAKISLKSRKMTLYQREVEEIDG